SAEAIEEKYGGYAFLASLPLRLETVVMAKFALPLIALAAGTAFGLYMFESIGGLPPVVRDCRNILLLGAAAIIVMAGISFLLLYRFGARNFMMILVVAGVALNLLGVVAFRKGLGDWVFEWLPRMAAGRSAWWLLVALCGGIAVYWLLMGAAVRIKRDRLFE
ncbi:MAG: ABC-2 transporter permease, partial [Candidatus Krumholzibacteria bacterium]|nr:ABC-2 transporter permease [Candidatus Krumholzibacteria bacterium]